MLLVLFSIFCIFLLIATIIICFTGYYYYSILFFNTAIISFLISMTLFYKKTNKYPINDIEMFDFAVKDFCTNDIKDKNLKIITFEFIDNCWICQNKDKIIKLDLSGYIFPRTYIKSFVIRNLRYKIISQKQPLNMLFKNKLFIKKDLNLNLVIMEENKVTKYNIVNNGISKYGLLCREITKSPFYHFFLSNRAFNSLKRIKFINETVYQKYRK